MSKINHLLKRKANQIANSRVSALTLAELAMFWQSEFGELPRSRSELVRVSLDLFAELLRTQNKVMEVRDVSSAMTILENLGLRTDDKRVRKALIKSLSADFTRTEDGIDKGLIDPDDDVVKQAQRILSGNLSETVETLEEAQARRKKESLDFKEQMNPTVNK